MFAVDAPGGAVLPVSSRKEKKKEEELVLFYLGFMLLQKKQKIKSFHETESTVWHSVSDQLVLVPVR